MGFVLLTLSTEFSKMRLFFSLMYYLYSVDFSTAKEIVLYLLPAFLIEFDILNLYQDPGNYHWTITRDYISLIVK